MAPHRLFFKNDYLSATIGSILFNLPQLWHWLNEPLLLDGFIWEFAIKLGTTILLGAAGAFAGVITKDLYKIVKNKINNRRRIEHDDTESYY